jgi:DNA-binding transcriptional MocR family regulator
MLCHSYLAQLTVAEYLAGQPWTDEIKSLCELYACRRDAMLGALGTDLPPGCTWTRPDGGFFVWLKLPGGLDAKAMLRSAIAAGVTYIPGTGFYADGSGREHIRLAFCSSTGDRIAEGISRLARVVHNELSRG